jgi:hypothetical protein
MQNRQNKAQAVQLRDNQNNNYVKVHFDLNDCFI